jgi:hypothetical protein
VLLLCAGLLVAKNADKLEGLIDRLERKAKVSAGQGWKG